MAAIFPRPDKFSPLTEADGKTALQAWFDFWGYLESQIKAIGANVASSRITGTTTNDDAAAGFIGEYLTAGPTTQALTNATPVNVTSRSLTAGDWEVWGPTQFTGAVATTTTDIQASLSLTSATLNTTVGQYEHWRGSVVDNIFPMCPGPLRLSLASTTTVFLVAQAAFSGGTYSANGFIRARRAR